MLVSTTQPEEIIATANHGDHFRAKLPLMQLFVFPEGIKGKLETGNRKTLQVQKQQAEVL